MNALSKFSSQQNGWPAAFAVDDYSGTVWMPEADDAQPSITVELSPATRFDVVQHFTVDAMRVMFSGGSRRGFGGGGATLPVYKYKLDVSIDGQTWTNVVDQSANKVPRNTVFDDIVPTECRYVRLTMLDWPKSSPLSILDMTVFGRPTSYFPNVNPIAPVLDMSNRD